MGYWAGAKRVSECWRHQVGARRIHYGEPTCWGCACKSRLYEAKGTVVSGYVGGFESRMATRA